MILLCLLAGTARADLDDEVTWGSHIRSLHSSSANAVTEKSLGGLTLGYSRLLPIETIPKLQLWGNANFVLGFADGKMFQTLDTQLSMGQIAVGVRASYSLWRDFVIANARLDAGMHNVELSLKDMQGHSASDDGWGAMSTAAVGVDVVPLRMKKFVLGLRAELGYVMTSAIDLTAKSEGAPEDTIELDRMAASMGHLDVGGKYLSFAITGLF